MALPRKFLNEDEELLAELRPHWIFLFGPLFTSIGVWAGLIVLVILWQKAPELDELAHPHFGPDPRPVAARSLRPLALLRGGPHLDPHPRAPGHRRPRHRPAAPAADHRGQHPPGADRAGPRYGLADHRRPGRGRLPDTRVHAQAGGGAARHQLADQRDRRRGPPRGHPVGHATADRYGAPYADRDADDTRHDDTRDDTERYEDAHDTPPFGVGGAASTPAAAVTPDGGGAASAGNATPGTQQFEIRDRLIELDDLRRRGILSEEEFAAKKSELLNRI